MDAITLCGCCIRPLQDGMCNDCLDCEHLPCCHGACLKWTAFCAAWTDVARLTRGNHPQQLMARQLRGARMIGRSV